MRRIITNALLFLVLGFGLVYGSSYELETLIDKEKVEQEEPIEEPGEGPPPANLLGNANSVALYSSALYGGDPSPICEALPFDELIDLAGGDPLAEEIVLNMKLPRVRQIVEDSCLIRPGDEVLAVGRGRQSWVLIRDFVIRKAQAVCPNDSPYSLTGRLERPLEEGPLFYSTDFDLKEGDNDFKTVEMSASAATLVRLVVPDITDYEVNRATVEATNVEVFFHLRRRRVTPDDDGFPNEALLWQKGDKVEVLSQERVDSVHGSGRLGIEAVLDYNRDGFLDVWIKGDQQKCVYHLLYEGGEEGFTPVELPNPPCSC